VEKRACKTWSYFELDDEHVDRLIAAGRKVLHESPEFEAFMKKTSRAD
jgi:hypothetical protein